jgi:hypothetical protein
MTIEMSIIIKDEYTTYTVKDILESPLVISKDNKELVEKVAAVYTQFVALGSQKTQESPEIGLKFKMIWQL